MHYTMKRDNSPFPNNICAIIIWKNHYITKDHKRRREIKYRTELLLKQNILKFFRKKSCHWNLVRNTYFHTSLTTKNRSDGIVVVNQDPLPLIILLKSP